MLQIFSNIKNLPQAVVRFFFFTTSYGKGIRMTATQDSILG